MTPAAAIDPVLETDGGGEAASPASPAYRRYALILLLLVYVVNFLDRQVINILAEPIKLEMHLSDVQIGLLSGLAFGLFYTVLGLPLARAADRYNRPFLIAGCLTAWSGFTGVCGLAQNFVQLGLARIGVGIGEAGCTPTAHALIADLTPKAKRASALAFYSMGTPIGSLLGLALGGAMADYFGWRKAFLFAAVPGLVLAVLCAVTLKEPRNALRKQAGHVAAAAGSFGETFRYLAAKRTFWLFAFGAAIRAFLGYGHAAFTASFFYRVHGHEVAALAQQFGMKPQTFMGLALGVLGGVAGTVGSYVGGQIADRAATRDLRAYGSVPAIAALISAPVTVFSYLTGSAALALLLLPIPYLLGTLWYGPVYATAQSVVPSRMRATSASMMLFVINFIGLGLGALCVGALSDLLAGPFHLGPAEGVRWALILSTIGGLVSVPLFWLGRRTVTAEIES